MGPPLSVCGKEVSTRWWCGELHWNFGNVQGWMDFSVVLDLCSIPLVWGSCPGGGRGEKTWSKWRILGICIHILATHLCQYNLHLLQVLSKMLDLCDKGKESGIQWSLGLSCSDKWIWIQLVYKHTPWLCMFCFCRMINCLSKWTKHQSHYSLCLPLWVSFPP